MKDLQHTKVDDRTYIFEIASDSTFDSERPCRDEGTIVVRGRDEKCFAN